MTPLSLLFLSFLLAGTASVLASATTIGVTYIPSPNLPPPERVATTLHSLHISAVRLLDPSPSLVRAFSYSNISLFLSVPNALVPSFAANRSASTLWLHDNVLPFYPRACVSIISVGNDFISTNSSSDLLLPAIRNVHLSLEDLGIKNVAVSTTFSFINVMTTSFPPSAAHFHDPIDELIIRPLLQFLEETHSSFLINLYPYQIFKLSSEIPLGFALFEDHPFNFRDDVSTGVRYRNMFDMMVDAVIAAMAVSGHENIPVVVAETGWPSSGDPEETDVYAESYLNGLISHLRSGQGTPLRKEGVAETYIYELFDENNNGTGQHWGFLHPNTTLKYRLNFSSSERMKGGGSLLKTAIKFLVIACLLILQ